MGVSTGFRNGASKYAGVLTPNGEDTTVTKKDFTALADALRQVAEHSSTDMETYLACCRAIATVAESDNLRFDRIRFIQACAPKRETT